MARSAPKVRSGGQRGQAVYSNGASGIGINVMPPQQQTNQSTQADEDEEDIVIDVNDTNDTNDNTKKDDTKKINHDDIDWDNESFPVIDDTEYAQIYSDNRASYKTNGNIRDAKKMYEMKQPKPTSDTLNNTSNVSWSQDLNHRLNHNQPLDTDSQFMAKYLTQALHPIGQNVTINRGAHGTVINDILTKAGINKTYDQLSQSQLNNALVGTDFSIKSFGSWATNENKNPFLGGPQAGGREVVMYARTAASTKVFLGAKDQTEIVTGMGQKARITSIKLTNRMAYPQKSGAKPVIEVYVDLW